MCAVFMDAGVFELESRKRGQLSFFSRMIYESAPSDPYSLTIAGRPLSRLPAKIFISKIRFCHDYLQAVYLQ